MAEEYPKWMYSKDQGSVLVENPEQAAALKGDWHDSPAEFGVETHPMASAMMQGPGLAAPAPGMLPPNDPIVGRVSVLEARVDSLANMVQVLSSQGQHGLGTVPADARAGTSAAQGPGAHQGLDDPITTPAGAHGAAADPGKPGVVAGTGGTPSQEEHDAADEARRAHESSSTRPSTGRNR